MLIPLIIALALAAPLAPIASADRCDPEPQTVVIRVEADGSQVDCGPGLQTLLKQLSGGDACCPDPQKSLKCLPTGGGKKGSEPQVIIKTIGADGACCPDPQKSLKCLPASGKPGCGEQVIIKTIGAGGACCPDPQKILKCLPTGGHACSDPQALVKTIVMDEDEDGGQPHVIYFNTDDEDGEESEVRIKTVILSDDDNPQGNASYYAIGGPALCLATGDQDKNFVITTSGPGDQQKAYIGVRISPIPAPLAAHVGEDGVMIVNVVEDSPAEQAGLERFDVIVAFDGQTIDSPQDLTTAAAAAEAGQMATITVLRGGRKQKLNITPASAPVTIDLRMMYDEPEETLLKDSVNMRGLTLRADPDGNWVMEDLGHLEGLSGMLGKLDALDMDLQLKLDGCDQLLGKLGKDLDVYVQPGSSSSSSSSCTTEAQVTVQINENGNVTTITSGPDGKIHVTTVDADGQESEATYDSPEEFEKADPKSFKCYGHTGTDVGPRAIWVQPGAARARKLRNEYQVDVEAKIREALEQAKQSQQQAQEQYQSARDEARRVIKRQSTYTHVDTEKLMVFKDADGSLKVVVTKNGGKISYEFDSSAAFQAAEPELYERVKDDLD